MQDEMLQKHPKNIPESILHLSWHLRADAQDQTTWRSSIYKFYTCANRTVPAEQRRQARKARAGHPLPDVPVIPCQPSAHPKTDPFLTTSGCLMWFSSPSDGRTPLPGQRDGKWWWYIATQGCVPSHLGREIVNDLDAQINILYAFLPG